MRKEKQYLLDEIKEKIDASKALVITRYEGLSPDLSDDFRAKLGEVGGSFAVVKKRVLLKAAETTGMPLEESKLAGHIGIMFAQEDPISATKALYNFAKENKGIFEVLGGHFDGQICSPEDVKQISTLPSQDEMRAQFLGTLEAPMSQTLAVVEALLTSVIHCLENKKEQSSE